jgi:hypothetical protein
MLTMQGLTLLKMSNFLQRKWTAACSPSTLLTDLAPSDFFLFGYVKEHLKGMAFLSYEGLLDAIGEMAVVFEHWMERLEWVSKNNGDYYP